MAEADFEITVGGPAPGPSPRATLTATGPAPSFESEGVVVTSAPVGSGALVTGRMAGVVTTIATLAGFAAGLVPWWYNLALAVVSIVAAGAVNMLSKVPSFAVGRPLVSTGTASTLLLAGGALGQWALTLPDGWMRGLAVGGSVLCFGLAGKPVTTARAGTP